MEKKIIDLDDIFYADYDMTIRIGITLFNKKKMNKYNYQKNYNN